MLESRSISQRNTVRVNPEGIHQSLLGRIMNNKNRSSASKGINNFFDMFLRLSPEEMDRLEILIQLLPRVSCELAEAAEIWIRRIAASGDDAHSCLPEIDRLLQFLWEAVCRDQSETESLRRVDPMTANPVSLDESKTRRRQSCSERTDGTIAHRADKRPEGRMPSNVYYIDERYR
jgi:hypothetical protein